MPLSEASCFKIAPDDRGRDATLREDQGWHHMDVRWLITRDRVGEEAFYLRPGDVAFVPRDVYHGLENGSDTETLITVWGYCGAASLEQAGYIIPEYDPDAPDYVRRPRR